MTAIDRSAAPGPLAKHAPDPIPALLLGRLAADRRHSGLGIGTALVHHVLATAIELNTKAACEAVGDWSNHLGFHQFDSHNPTTADLYLLTSEIEATIRGVG